MTPDTDARCSARDGASEEGEFEGTGDGDADFSTTSLGGGVSGFSMLIGSPVVGVCVEGEFDGACVRSKTGAEVEGSWRRSSSDGWRVGDTVDGVADGLDVGESVDADEGDAVTFMDRLESGDPTVE